MTDKSWEQLDAAVVGVMLGIMIAIPIILALWAFGVGSP